MAQHADVIVVGGGLSGSVISAYLAKQGGKKVIAFEKSDLIGGPQYGGYYIDGGWHADLTHIPVYTVRDNGGEGKGGWTIPVAEELGAGFSWQYLPNYAINQGGKTLRQPCITEGREFVKFLREMLPFPMEEETEQAMAASFEAMRAFPEEKLWSEWGNETPSSEWFSANVTDDLALTIWELMVAQTACVDPDGALDALSISGVIGSVQGLWRGDTNMLGIMGGVDQIPKAFFKVAKENGAELLLSTPVKNIIIQDKKAVGVVAIVDGKEVEYYADQVVIATPYWAYADLLGENMPESFKEILAKWDDDPVVDLDIHFGLPEPAIHTPWSFCSMVDDAGTFESLIAALPDFGCGTMPEGKQIIQLQSFMRKNEFDQKTEAEHEETMISAVERLFPDIRKAIANAEWRHATYSYNPLSYPISPTKKMPFIVPGIDSLFLCGAATYGWGMATDRAVSSAMRLYKEVLQ